MAIRDAKKDNLVIHNLPEPDSSVTDGEARKKLDQSTIQELFSSIEVKVNMEDDIKFISRPGDRPTAPGGGPRPVILGFRSSNLREDVIKSANKLAKTKFRSVSIIPDLTKTQRNLEASMRKEAESLTKQLSAEEAKNWEYRLMGIRGQREIRKVRRRPEGPNHLQDQRTKQQKRPAENRTPKQIQDRLQVIAAAGDTVEVEVETEGVRSPPNKKKA